MGWGFFRVTDVCEEKIWLHQQPCYLHDTIPAPPVSPFHLGFMSFCTVSIDYEHLQFSWGDFSTPDFPGFNIDYQGQQSTDPAAVMRFFLRLSAIPTSTQETLSAPFSVSDKHNSIKSVFPHKGLQLPWWLVSGTDLLSYPLLPISLYTEIKTVATASPSLPKMDFIRVLLLATGLASPSEL